MDLPQRSNIENLVLRTSSEFNGSAGIECELCWSIGVLEYWSTGVLECWQKRKPKFYLNWSSHYSITPPLLQTAARLKEYGSTLRGQCKAGSAGSGFFIPLFL